MKTTLSNALLVTLALALENGCQVSARLNHRKELAEATDGEPENDPIGPIEIGDGEPMPSIESRIVGGTVVTSDEYSFFASLGGCGAALIHEDILLSAAHCFSGIQSYARIGSNDRFTGGERINIATKVRHPNHNTRTQSHDFMILKLENPSSYAPVAVNTRTNYPIPGNDLTVIGMGLTSQGAAQVSSVLREVTVDMYSDTQCRETYATYGIGFESEVMLCAGRLNKDSCQGDSGGPILGPDDSVVGVVSWGVGCGTLPGVYAETSYVKDWIQDMICELSENPPTSCPGSGSDPGDDGGSDNPPSGGNRSLRLRVTYDGYPEESGWLLMNVATGQEVDRRNFGSLSDENAGATIDYLYTGLPRGDYYFLLGDDFGDGICCRWGRGSARIYQEQNNGNSKQLWRVNGRFGSYIETVITLN